MSADTTARPDRPPTTIPKVLRPRVIWSIARESGLGPTTIVFASLFLAASAIVALSEPAVGGFRNAAWLMFEAATTIGFGDFTCVTPVGRAACVLLSVSSLVYLALITGAVVSYCQESMAARRDESVAAFLDQLEHLPELSPEELKALSAKVRELRKDA